jgi:hypothetical protein
VLKRRDKVVYVHYLYLQILSAGEGKQLLVKLGASINCLPRRVK